MNHEEKCGDSKEDGESLKALDELANPPGFSEDYLMAEAVDETMYVSEFGRAIKVLKKRNGRNPFKRVTPYVYKIDTILTN